MKLSENSPELFSNIYPGDIAIDCGANVGNVTEKMAEKGAIVYAFEPNPSAFQILKNRFSYHSNVICINKGVWHQNTKMSLFLPKEDAIEWTVSSSIYKNQFINPNNSVEIDIIDLTEFITQLTCPIKLLKIDIEGAEFELLEKLINLNLHTKVEKIVVETHEWLFPGLLKQNERVRSLIRNKNIDNIDLNWQ